MPKTNISYLEIGHRSPDDILWIIRLDSIEKIAYGTKKHIHEYLWNAEEVANSWRGRFEKKTGFCSIVPPGNRAVMSRPPLMITDMLLQNFPVSEFVYFNEGNSTKFSPNPKKNRKVVW